MAITSTSTQITVVACQTGRGTITLTDSQDVICVHVLDGVHFDFDFSACQAGTAYVKSYSIGVPSLVYY